MASFQQPVPAWMEGTRRRRSRRDSREERSERRVARRSGQSAAVTPGDAADQPSAEPAAPADQSRPDQPAARPGLSSNAATPPERRDDDPAFPSIPGGRVEGDPDQHRLDEDEAHHEGHDDDALHDHQHGLSPEDGLICATLLPATSFLSEAGLQADGLSVIPDTPLADLSKTFLLHSNPNASKTIYLNRPSTCCRQDQRGLGKSNANETPVEP